MNVELIKLNFMKNPYSLTSEQIDELVSILKERFEKNMKRHPNCNWNDIAAKLEKNEAKLYALNEMEISGGEPDIVEYKKSSDESKSDFIFFDCSAESPKGRRSLCYDRAALDSRKEHKPANSAIDMANEMGIEILNEEQYRFLQTLGKFDLKTSSWVLTPSSIRDLGGAVFCDRRYNTVFLYHNGAESYYAARGFRGMLRL